ncbi:hypothetical protein [uncultured Flavobacterium sp.]|uniref:hypothetical protein n=1 Tax=uncultured Flavobacterium sp. TaxID=165435 RepID=UPI0030ED085F|tara:strand:+ start:77530 stop:78414 length:885 start_codon:yes stop_codon:yes gene_type:complete
MKLIRNLFISIFILFLFFWSCGSSLKEDLIVLYKLPKSLKEVSGIAITDNLTWVIEDAGNKNKIYGLTEKGKIEIESKVSNIDNIDWEDLTTDTKGNLYIGDFGNNENERKDLCIYSIDKSNLKKDIISVDKTTFSYPEQTKFPPKKKDLLFDCEAFFEWDGNFYLFTKNRSKNFDGTCLVYKIANQKGEQKAELISSFKTCTNDNNCTITSAAINSNGTKVVLLTHDAVFLFENFKGDDFTNGTMKKLELNHVSQKESICFKDDATLLIADERNGKLDGNVYEVKLTDLKSKS